MPASNITIFDRPEQIDAVINAKLAQMPRKNGKCNSIAGRWTQQEIELRNAVIMQYIAEQGLSKERTAQQLTNRWNITLETARSYVKKAIDDFANSYSEETQEKNRKLWLERVEQVLQDCIDSRDKQSALKAMDMMGKAFGIYTEKKDINLEGNATISFDFE